MISASELAFGAAIVVLHNVYRAVSNEVPILAGLALLSMLLRGGGASLLGLNRPKSWRRLVLLAIAAAALRIALGDW